MIKNKAIRKACCFFWQVIIGVLLFNILKIIGFDVEINFDLTVFNNLKAYSSNAEILSFLFLFHLITLPFCFGVWWWWCTDVQKEKITNVTLINVVLFYVLFISIFVGMWFISPDMMVSERMESRFVRIFESRMLFYLFFLYPFPFMSWVTAWSIKNLAIFKY